MRGRLIDFSLPLMRRAVAPSLSHLIRPSHTCLDKGVNLSAISTVLWNCANFVSLPGNSSCYEFWHPCPRMARRIDRKESLIHPALLLVGRATLTDPPKYADVSAHPRLRIRVCQQPREISSTRRKWGRRSRDRGLRPESFIFVQVRPANEK